MIDQDDKALAKSIRATESSRKPIEGALETDERVLARITEGIYRQPASALRELISNAYDADASEVVILTDAPRFGQISVRDNGLGLTPEALTQLVRHIGGSAKRSEIGKELRVTSATDPNRSLGGRQLIGKLGIGLFSVAQFTRHFLIITKTEGEAFRTVADITLGSKRTHAPDKIGQFETGHFRIWREASSEKDAHGTEIKLLDLLPRTRDELASDDVWTKLEYQQVDQDAEPIEPPKIHIGRMEKKSGRVSVQPSIPWVNEDGPRIRFEKLVQAVRSFTSVRESVDLRKVSDNYFWTLWTLALSVPVEYLEGHPFDQTEDSDIEFFEVENRLKGQAKRLSLRKGQTVRDSLGLVAPDGPTSGQFEVFMDGIQILRPILFKDLPKTSRAVKTPLLFVGRHREGFGKKAPELSGGELAFEAYLFWAPRIIPAQHQGVILRVGNASGALFDPEFMGYETSEITRKSQVTAEIFVFKGLDDAINIDRESFNYAHPHYQYLTKWLHSAFRQFSNRHKEIGKRLLSEKRKAETAETQERVTERVEVALRERGIEDVPEVRVVDASQKGNVARLRREGKIVLHREIVVPQSTKSRLSEVEEKKVQIAERKAIAITQLLHAMGLLESLSFSDQEKLVRDILDIVLLED